MIFNLRLLFTLFTGIHALKIAVGDEATGGYGHGMGSGSSTVYKEAEDIDEEPITVAIEKEDGTTESATFSVPTLREIKAQLPEGAKVVTVSISASLPDPVPVKTACTP